MSLLERAKAIEAGWATENQENDIAPYERTKKTNYLPWPPRPHELAKSSLRKRERWGLRANELEDMGVPWPEHERQAFEQIKELEPDPAVPANSYR
jgi:hypothetical protein